MKAVLLTLLASVLALQPGAALQCYSCKTQVSNTHCRHVQNCTQNETQCWTERIRAIGFLTIISKGCSSHCMEDWQDYYLGKKNVTCCSTDLCNASGAHALQPAIATLVLLVALGGLLLWGPDQLSPPGGPRCCPNQAMVPRSLDHSSHARPRWGPSWSLRVCPNTGLAMLHCPYGPPLAPSRSPV